MSIWKGLVASAALLSALALTACGSSGGQHSRDGKGDVTMWMYPTIVDPKANAAFWNKATADFEKQNPGIHVTVDTQPWEGREQKQATALSSGKGLDLVLVIPDQIPQFVSQGVISPVDDALSADKEQFLPTALQAVTDKNHAYGVPLYQTTNVPIYNKALFTRAGITTLPSTWDEILADAPKLAAKGVPILDYPAGSPVTLNLSFYPLLWEAGGHIFNADGKAAFNDDAGVRTLQFLLNLKNMGGLPKNTVSEGNTIEGSQLAAGKSAMMLAVGPEAVGQLGAAIGAGKVAIGPPLTGAKQVTYGVPGSVALAKHAQNPVGAMKFLTYLGSAGVIKDFSAACGYFPTRKDVPQQASAPKQFIDALPETFPGELQAGARQAMTLISPHIQAALAGKVSAKQALDAAAADVNSMTAARR